MWQTKREVKIENIGDNIFIFKFGNEADKKRKKKKTRPQLVWLCSLLAAINMKTSDMKLLMKSIKRYNLFVSIEFLLINIKVLYLRVSQCTFFVDLDTKIIAMLMKRE